MNESNKKRKVVEIFVTEGNNDDVSFTVEKVEESEIADLTMKMMLNVFAEFKDEEDTLEVEYE